MFVDEEKKVESAGETYHLKEKQRSQYEDAFYVALILIGIVGFVGLFVWLINRPKGREVRVSVPGIVSTSSVEALPKSRVLDGDNGLIGTSTDGIKMEDLTFGHFYKKPKLEFEAKFNSYDLPLNVKVDVANYYDVSRKLDLDDYVDDINKDGFAIIGKQSGGMTSDFFSAYRYLLQREVPIVVTSDFVFYYYQNALKSVYKEIEKNAFYENVWNINKKLFDIALTRYKKRLNEVGVANDPLLEAARLEMSYFAVVLTLLSPTPNQVDKSARFSDETKFNEQEADQFSFLMPSYLKEEVEKEVKLIRGAGGYEKSPVFLYERDYSYFNVPQRYGGDAKLNNFYVALRMLNTVFPLYYKSEECPDCLLDKDDWLINMIASNYITRDIQNSSELKAQWAVVYKFISFFSGLRDDLTYIHYNDVLTRIFGEDYDVDRVFSLENINREYDIKRIQTELSEVYFDPIEGGIDNRIPEARSRLGMRILQESYWPNSYIFEQFVGKDIKGDKSGDQYSRDELYYFSACIDSYEDPYYRCKGFSYDLINLFYPVNNSDKYYLENVNYDGYKEALTRTKKRVGEFDVYGWNNNMYWMTLDLIKPLLISREGDPVYTLSDNWKNKRDINSALGAWANLHFTQDLLEGYSEVRGSALGGFKQCNLYNYIEPNEEFIRSLIAKNEMLLDMFAVLHISKKTNAAGAELRDVNVKLHGLLKIIKKEAKGEMIEIEDCRIIEEFVKHYRVSRPGTRSFSVDYDSGRKIIVSNNGVKFVAFVYRVNNRNMLVFGPVSDFSER